MSAQGTVSGLKELLANTYALYLKTQNYHWNVVGPQFFYLHTLFETQYKELAEAVDEIAERIRALGEMAPGSFKEFSTLKSIDEAKNNLDAMGMIKDLKESHEVLFKTLNATLTKARESHDEVSQDLIIERLEVHEKTIWMLKSHLG